MPETQILCRMCDNSVNKAFHGLAAILLVRLVGQPPKNVKKEICPHRCFAFSLPHKVSIVAVRVVLSVFAPTRASSISRHLLEQG